jgi:uncharacterized protein (DUF885 family)
VTETRAAVALSRPDRAIDAGPLDDRFYDLVETRFRRLVRDNPVYGTYVGLHDGDDRWGDGSRDAQLQELGDERAHLATMEALDPAGLSATARFEREIEMHNVRRIVFDTEVVRTWERRSTALDLVGDGLFLGLARDFAPLADRLGSLTARLEAVPGFLLQHRTRAVVPQVRMWQAIELGTARDLPSFFDVIVDAGRGTLDERAQARLERAATGAAAAVGAHGEWVRSTLPDAVDDWPLGRDRYDELVGLRAFDGFDADAILEIGEQQLAQNKAARVAVAREIDPTVDEATVIDRIKSDQPPSFEAALTAYRDAMFRARQHLTDHDLVTVPPGEHLDVVPTPEYLRNLIPFAAYFDPPKFDRDPGGIYIVTPSVGDDPRAMREHNYSSISNTSIHEAYPGHHLQFAVATRHPSLTRLQSDAPEFHEGWAMYSEQMMREEGFDDGPSFRAAMYTDAIWRACRIILDVRMHRGEISVPEAIRFLVARAEVHRYTYTPTYQLSYLLGKVLLLQLRADERRRLGEGFSLKGFHDALLRAGNLPVRFQRRLLQGEAG